MERVITRKKMSDTEAQGAPPSAPVEDNPQPERKVIGRGNSTLELVMS